MLEGADFKEEEIVEPSIKSGEGVGIIEAPRGLLYHYFKIKDAKVVKSRVIVPTSQNQIKMEKDIGLIVERFLKSKDKKYIEWEIEKIIRAYDPCMSCAAHFLKVNWNEG